MPGILNYVNLMGRETVLGVFFLHIRIFLNILLVSSREADQGIIFKPLFSFLLFRIHGQKDDARRESSSRKILWKRRVMPSHLLLVVPSKGEPQACKVQKRVHQGKKTQHEVVSLRLKENIPAPESI
jgi:hypothetical protein